MTLYNFTIYVLGALALAGAFGLVFSKAPINSILSLILNFFCIGGLFLTLNAEFLAIIQIIVYAGAILVLFLFVIMLLNLSVETPDGPAFDWQKGSAYILGIAFLVEMLMALGKLTLPAPAEVFAFGKVEPIGASLYTGYLFPFEMISLILLAALMGALIIAKKHKYD